MSKRKTEKKITFYEPGFQDVLVCKNPDDSAYLEIFHEKPENVSLEGLGSLLGIFEINDDSEDSSYIPNYLISIIKKEFYSRPKRGSIESFEMALHKANLALSQLASQGNIGWLGKLNAVCAVIEKNNFHLAQTGEMSVLLIRFKTLTNLSDEEETVIADPNPLKTFRDVLSGRLEKDDKIIITTNAIFQIFSIDELKNGALKFSKRDFVQFLNTALVNQLDRAAVLVTDFEEQEKEAVETIRKPLKLNAFSQKSYLKKESSEDSGLGKEEEKKVLIEEIKKEYEKTKGEFVDEKTGHIYIREGADQERSENRVLGNIKSYAKSLAVGSERNLEKISGARNGADQKLEIAAENIAIEKDSTSSSISQEPAKKFRLALPKIPLEKIKKIFPALKGIFGKFLFFLARILKYRVAFPLLALFKKTGAKIADFKKSRSGGTPSGNDFSSTLSSSASVKKFLPDFSRMKIIYSGLDKKRKFYAAAVLLLIFVIPYFISRTITKMEENRRPVVSQQASPPEIPLKDDKNVIRIESLNEAYSGTKIVGLVNAKGSFFALTRDSLVSLTDQNIFSLPENFQSPNSAFEMDDLNLIFILKENRLVSFSPASKKFQENNIEIPGNARIEAAGSFLTYIYLFDSSNSQIYRYPRAEGGFGQKANWIKDQVDLSAGKSLAINESIFISNEGGIQKFLKGKREEYPADATSTPIIPDKLYTKPDSENLYILDATNARIVKLDKNGSIALQFYNPEIQAARDFAVDEQAKIIYFSSENSVKSFNFD